MQSTAEGATAEALAVVVLYRMSPDESPAFRSLLAASKPFEGKIACILYDNSPDLHSIDAHSLDAAIACTYHHDPGNPGLAVAYQYAFEKAERENIPWLLLLDQDTLVHEEYLREALQAISDLRLTPGVNAIAPKLLQDGVLLSPHWPHGEGSRRRFEDRHGLLEPHVKVFNSGSLLRTEAVRAVGGFPLDFPLDYLDHAMFARLRGYGNQTFLLRSALEHRLESKWQNVPRTLKSSPRLQRTFAAEVRFYRQFGTRMDRLLLAFRRAKLAIRMVLYGEVRSLLQLARCTF